MKKWFDNIFIRIGFVIIILSIFFIIIFQRFKVFTFDKKWYEEDKLINRMNVEKLQNKWWKSYPLWIHEGETLEAKKEGVKRILIIGDSYVWGWGYSNANHLWWKQFSLLLKQEGYNNVEVVVAGISGYNTKQEFEYIIKNKELINQVNPDCIVLCYVSNDVEIKDEDGNFFIKYNEDRDMFKNSNNKFINFFKENFNSLYNIFNTLMFKKYGQNENFRKRYGLDYVNWLAVQSEGKYIQEYEENIVKPMKEYIDNNFKVPFFVYMPATLVRGDVLNIDNVIDTFEKNEIKFYYSYDYTEGEELKFGNNTRINPANNHPSVLMCKSFAQQFLLLMKEKYPEILGEKSGIYEPKLNINDYMPYKINLEKVSENIYNFRYPALNEEDAFLSLPVYKNYIKLNLEEPISMKKIILEIEDKENVKSVEIWINTIDKREGYDKQEMKSLGITEGEYTWDIDTSLKVTSINVNVETLDGKEKLVKIIMY